MGLGQADRQHVADRRASQGVHHHPVGGEAASGVRVGNGVSVRVRLRVRVRLGSKAGVRVRVRVRVG